MKKDGILIAPTFVYDSLNKKLKLKSMEKAGFKTFNKWTSQEYKVFIEKRILKQYCWKR